MREHDEERVKLISAFSLATTPLLLLNALFIYLAAHWLDCESLSCTLSSRYLVVFVVSTLAGLALMIRLHRSKLSRDQAAWHGVLGLLLLLMPFIMVVGAWQSPRQLLLGW